MGFEPRTYDVSNPDERKRLLRETWGYLNTSEHNGLRGHRWALDEILRHCDQDAPPISSELAAVCYGLLLEARRGRFEGGDSQGRLYAMIAFKELMAHEGIVVDA